MRIALTGADGFVGRHTVGAVRAAGHEALPLVRRLGSGSEAGARAVGDIGPDTEWTSVIEGCDAVVHLAAAVHESGPESADHEARMRRVNVDATARLAREAARCGVRRVVLASSIKVMGETSSRSFVESDPPRPVGAYATSKRDAELALWETTSATTLEGVVLRPPLVYGPGVGANFRALLGLCDTAWPLPLAGARALRSLLYVGNLADALVVTATRPEAAGDTFFVTDDNDVSVADLVTRLRQVFSRPNRLLTAPLGVLRWTARLAGREDAIARLFEPLRASPAHLRSRLSWKPPFTVDEGLANTARWFAMQRSQQRP
jgi:nucleoside-diphosphate-sugar epimerase